MWKEVKEKHLEQEDEIEMLFAIVWHVPGLRLIYAHYDCDHDDHTREESLHIKPLLFIRMLKHQLTSLLICVRTRLPVVLSKTHHSIDLLPTSV